MAFKDLGLNQTILSTLDKLGYTEPTPIQAQAIPPVLEGLDVMAAAQTGYRQNGRVYAAYLAPSY